MINAGFIWNEYEFDVKLYQIPRPNERIKLWAMTGPEENHRTDECPNWLTVSHIDWQIYRPVVMRGGPAVVQSAFIYLLGPLHPSDKNEVRAWFEKHAGKLSEEGEHEG